MHQNLIKSCGRLFLSFYSVKPTNKALYKVLKCFGVHRVFKTKHMKVSVSRKIRIEYAKKILDLCCFGSVGQFRVRKFIVCFKTIFCNILF